MTLGLVTTTQPNPAAAPQQGFWRLNCLPPKAKQMLLELDRLAEQEIVQISVPELTNLLEIKQETVYHRLNTLQKHDAIDVRRLYNGSGLEIRLILKVR
jgi:hypothetical protein